MGLEPMVVPTVPKEDMTTFLYVGRMAPSKRVHDIIEAFARFRAQGRAAKLWLIGDGTSRYLADLRRQVARLRLDGTVEFLGRVAADVKHDRMTRAHVLLMASVREGWGLSIVEANVCGTPAVVYDVPGLRDAVRNRETGFVVPPTPDSLADGMERITADTDLYQRLAQAAKLWSSSFSFDTAAQEFRVAVSAAVSASGG
jgi:glycosyltransferase involved in cell wall biosynthesis